VAKAARRTPRPKAAPPPNGVHPPLPAPPSPPVPPSPWLAASLVTAAPVEWIVPGLIPRGQLTLVVGQADVGKSTLYASLIAWCTGAPVGDPMPYGHPPGRAVLYSPESSAPRETIGRLQSAGADLERVALGDLHASGGRARRLSLPDCVGAAAEQWREARVSMVVIDPIASYLSAGISPMDGQHVRSVLEPLCDVAERESITILCTCHYRKAREGTPLDWVAGAAAWTQVPRHVVALGVDPERPSQRVMVAAKYSGGAARMSRSYEIVDTNGYGRVVIGDVVGTTAADLGRQLESEDRDALEDASAFLTQILSDGEQRQTEIMSRARMHSIAPRTLYRAKGRLGVRSQHRGVQPDRHLVWVMAGPNGAGASDGQ
jgi:putative DNA primase/helicase